MPGQVLTIAAGTGTAVASGDSVVILEAMKMEHAVPATRSGVVSDVVVREGDQVTRGQRLAVIQPPETG
jgi:3-methylcrotonyl-CoA carboxylase alpha subunit